MASRAPGTFISERVLTICGLRVTTGLYRPRNAPRKAETAGFLAAPMQGGCALQRPADD